MAGDKAWIIVNCYCLIGLESEFIPPKQRPTCIHVDRNAAEKELLRLQRTYPNEVFMLFESVATAEQSEADHNVYFIEEVDEQV